MGTATITSLNGMREVEAQHIAMRAREAGEYGHIAVRYQEGYGYYVDGYKVVNGQRIERTWTRRAIEEEQATCSHPATRLYAWTAGDGTRCVACNECGAALEGAS
jgi:hypothetical protein